MGRIGEGRAGSSPILTLKFGVAFTAPLSLTKVIILWFGGSNYFVFVSPCTPRELNDSWVTKCCGGAPTTNVYTNDDGYSPM